MPLEIMYFYNETRDVSVKTARYVTSRHRKLEGIPLTISEVCTVVELKKLVYLCVER